MPISNPAKIAIGLASVGGAGGISYVAYSQLSAKDSKDSFAKTLGISVLSLTGETDSTAWGARYTEFTSATATELDSSLSKTDVTTWQKLQAWCKNNKDNDYDKDDKKFKNFESFCTWKIGDKLTGHIGKDVKNTEQKWKDAHSALKTNGAKKTLSTKLKEVFNTVATTDNKADQVAMHKWCTDNYKVTWKGNSEEIFKEVQEYCKEPAQIQLPSR